MNASDTENQEIEMQGKLRTPMNQLAFKISI